MPLISLSTKDLPVVLTPQPRSAALKDCHSLVTTSTCSLNGISRNLLVESIVPVDERKGNMNGSLSYHTIDGHPLEADRQKYRIYREMTEIDLTVLYRSVTPIMVCVLPWCCPLPPSSFLPPLSWVAWDFVLHEYLSAAQRYP
jgi:hypothetical protein